MLRLTTREISISPPLDVTSTPDVGYNTRLDYRDVIFCHAQLYIFADAYDTRSLGELTVARLQENLVQYQLDKTSSAPVIDLIDYVCENTPADPDHRDPLKELLVCFVANKLEKLSEVAQFRALLREGGCFVDRLMCRVAEGLAG